MAVLLKKWLYIYRVPRALLTILVLHTFSTNVLAALVESIPPPGIHEAVEKFSNNKNPYIFYGLASYYNNTSYFVVDVNSITPINSGMEITLKDAQWVALSHRYDVLVIKAPGLTVKVIDGQLDIDDRAVSSVPVLKISSKDKLFKLAPELDQLRYNHLWAPFACLSRVTEVVLVSIQKSQNRM